MKGIPCIAGLPLNSSTDEYGHRRISCPFTFMEKAMLPTAGTIDTDVWCFVSESSMTSPLRRAVYCCPATDVTSVSRSTMQVQATRSECMEPLQKLGIRTFSPPLSADWCAQIPTIVQLTDVSASGS